MKTTQHALRDTHPTTPRPRAFHLTAVSQHLNRGLGFARLTRGLATPKPRVRLPIPKPR